MLPRLGRRSPYARRTYFGCAESSQILPKLWFLVVVSDVDAEPVIAAICEAAATREPGDGKIFVTEVSEVIRVRTRERGAAALTGGTPVTPQA